MKTTWPPGAASRAARLIEEGWPAASTMRSQVRPSGGASVTRKVWVAPGLARLLQLLFRDVDGDDLGAAHQLHPLDGEEADRAAADDAAALAHGRRGLPDRVQGDRGRIGHGDGARIGPLPAP